MATVLSTAQPCPTCRNSYDLQGASIAYTNLVSPALAPYLGQAGVGGRVKVSSRVPAATSGAPSKVSGGTASASTASTSRGTSSVVVPPQDELRALETNELKVMILSKLMAIASLTICFHLVSSHAFCSCSFSLDSFCVDISHFHSVFSSFSTVFMIWGVPIVSKWI